MQAWLDQAQAADAAEEPQHGQARGEWAMICTAHNLLKLRQAKTSA